MSAHDPADFTEKGDCPACHTPNVPLKDISGLLICEKCAAKKFSSKVRKSIQDAFDRQLKQQQRENWIKRIGVAKKAIAYYEDAKFQEATKTFKDYLMILESHHGVQAGGLTPRHFADPKEAGEILLISGIYWDMAKIFDRTKGRATEMRLALNKFYEFAADQPHLILASEAMRRYIASPKCVHKTDFQDTHRLLRSKLANCFVAGALFGPSALETNALRAFRDGVLRRKRAGRIAIAAYYRISPPIARWLATRPRAAAFARLLLGPFARAIGQRITVPTRDGRK